MRTASIFVFAALIGAAAFSSTVSAQNARDAAIHKCVNEAQARFPNVGEETTMRARTDVYVSCMRAAGQNP